MGRIKCVSSATGFTVDEVYDLVSVIAPGGDVAFVTINDNDAFVVVTPGASFEVVELYGVRKII